MCGFYLVHSVVKSTRCKVAIIIIAFIGCVIHGHNTGYLPSLVIVARAVSTSSIALGEIPLRAGTTYLVIVVTALIWVRVLETVEAWLLVNSPCSRLDALLLEVTFTLTEGEELPPDGD